MVENNMPYTNQNRFMLVNNGHFSLRNLDKIALDQGYSSHAFGVDANTPIATIKSYTDILSPSVLLMPVRWGHTGDDTKGLDALVQINSGSHTPVVYTLGDPSLYSQAKERGARDHLSLGSPELPDMLRIILELHRKSKNKPSEDRVGEMTLRHLRNNIADHVRAHTKDGKYVGDTFFTNFLERLNDIDDSTQS